jgi:multidrug efflux pump subunit AcrB
MKLVLAALKRPISVLVAVVAVALFAFLALHRMPVDIFPNLGSPAIYVAQPYGGMDPQQMEGYLTYYLEYHFLYITGIEHVESKNIQGIALLKLTFHPGTDMSQAMAQVVGYVNRAHAFMPTGTVAPFIVRYDAGSVPVGQLVFSSPNRNVGEMQDIALNRVRPVFAILEGVSAPPPFGGNQRTIVIQLDPDRLHAYNISAQEAVLAVNRSSVVMPAGTVGTGDLTRIASSNVTLGGKLDELLDTPIRLGTGPSVYLRDIGTIENGTDIVVGYAHVNGKRTVYIPVTKRSDASTLAVIRRVREALPRMKAVAPDDVDIRLEFDQSKFVVNAIRALMTEGGLGALLTAAMVLLFLRDWRSAIIVTITIPFALLSALVSLWITGQSVNIMTLGGLALAVGVLVDEATVEIENIHTLLDAARESGLSRAQAVVEACRKTAMPRLLAMLCVLSVFVPSIFMAGVAKQMFVPLSLAVGFAMISSYMLSTTLVPVLATWIMHEAPEGRRPPRWREWYASALRRFIRRRWAVVGVYAVVTVGILVMLIPHVHMEIFPETDTGQFQLRLRALTGTRIERTEMIALKALDIIKRQVGPENVEMESDFVGVQPPNYPVNTIFLFTSGPHEAVMLVALRRNTPLRGEALKERLRHEFARELPNVEVSFEAGDIITQIMSFGSPTPVEVAVQGPNLAIDRSFAERVRTELSKISNVRDLQYGQPLNYPTVQVAVDRNRAGQFNLTVDDVAKTIVAATSSSRFIEPNFWRDPVSGNGFQIQVEIPQNRVRSIDDVKGLRLSGDGPPTLLRDVASVQYGTTVGEVDRYDSQRVVSLTANLHDEYLGDAAKQVRQALQRVGNPPRGVTVAVRGQIPPLLETVSGLRSGLLLSMVVIFLLLTFNFQSLRLASIVLLTVPAVLCGVLAMLVITHTTLNVQSFMGAIMAVGVAVANAILLLTFSEFSRKNGAPSAEAALEGGHNRSRAILMTAAAMIFGMIPMALGLTESGKQAAPLARAVIGGLMAATISTLFFLPSIYAIILGHTRFRSSSLSPYDPESRYYENA